MSSDPDLFDAWLMPQDDAEALYSTPISITGIPAYNMPYSGSDMPGAVFDREFEASVSSHYFNVDFQQDGLAAMGDLPDCGLQAWHVSESDALSSWDLTPAREQGVLRNNAGNVASIDDDISTNSIIPTRQPAVATDKLFTTSSNLSVAQSSLSAKPSWSQKCIAKDGRFQFGAIDDEGAFHPVDNLGALDQNGVFHPMQSPLALLSHGTTQSLETCGKQSPVERLCRRLPLWISPSPN